MTSQCSTLTSTLSLTRGRRIARGGRISSVSCPASPPPSASSGHPRAASTMSSSTFFVKSATMRSPTSAASASSPSLASEISAILNGRTQRSGTLMRRYSGPQISRTTACLRRASPSHNDVATVEPGWMMRVDRAMPPSTSSASASGRREQCSVARMHSCSCPQTTTSRKEGRHASMPRDCDFVRSVRWSRFWWMSKRLNQSSESAAGRRNRTLSA